MNATLKEYERAKQVLSFCIILIFAGVFVTMFMDPFVPWILACFGSYFLGALIQLVGLKGDIKFADESKPRIWIRREKNGD